MEYPSWRFHATEEPRIISGPGEEQDGWADSPAAHGIETAPGVEPDPEIARRAAELAAATALPEVAEAPRRRARKQA